MSKKEFDIKANRRKLTAALQQLRRYSLLGFIVLIALLYGFVLFQINNLSNVVPSATAVNTNVQSAQVPRIDPSVISQLKSLQDNSVSVKSIFEQARNNPFQ